MKIQKYPIFFILVVLLGCDRGPLSLHFEGKDFSGEITHEFKEGYQLKKTYLFDKIKQEDKEGYYIPKEASYRGYKTILSSNANVIDENLTIKNVGKTKITATLWNKKIRATATFDVTITKGKAKKLDTIRYTIAWSGLAREPQINRKKLFKTLYDKGYTIEKITVADTDIVSENLHIQFLGTTTITVDLSHPNILNTQAIIKIKIMDIANDGSEDGDNPVTRFKGVGTFCYMMHMLEWDSDSLQRAKYKDYKIINVRVVDTSMAVLDLNEIPGKFYIRFKKEGLVRVVYYLKHLITQKTAIGVVEMILLEKR